MPAKRQRPELTAHLILRAYSIGVFPMAKSAEDPDLIWLDPDERGVFPLNGLIISKSLAKVVRSDRFTIRVDHDFKSVIAACASNAKRQEETWINQSIRDLYEELFQQGFVHTIEAYDEQDHLVGGLYGVALGGAFFGESMFHLAPNASKVALVHLIARLKRGHYQLLDTQFITPHLQSLGAIEIPREDFHTALEAALGVSADVSIWSPKMILSGAEALTLARAETHNSPLL
ncbi:MAG: leucyl/phenylalanyl-tRNA--protein transferase [Alphaproteobacteria bacterium]|nr:leucyl/phenylalanyl-tRNA--protein transferase [Alphaproteobacteria bacterium]